MVVNEAGIVFRASPNPVARIMQSRLEREIERGTIFRKAVVVDYDEGMVFVEDSGNKLQVTVSYSLSVSESQRDRHKKRIDEIAKSCRMNSYASIGRVK